MTMPEIVVENRNGTAVITLNAPERRNAITVEMSRELTAACDAIDADPRVGAVVIRGSGPTFCAGADRSLLARVGEDPLELQRRADLLTVYQAFIRVGHLQAPTIAAVRGVAIGAGLNLVYAADLRVVADDATLTAGFLKIGVHPGGGHFSLVGRTAGREAVAALTIFGESLSGRVAAARGLVWKSVPDEQVDETAMRLAAEAARDPELSRLTIRMLRSEFGPPMTPWEVAADAELANQMWSLHRRIEGHASNKQQSKVDGD